MSDSKTKLTVSSKTYLTGAPPDIQHRVMDHLTIENPLYLDAIKAERFTGYLEQYLCFYEQTPAGLAVPRGWTAGLIDLLRGQGIEPVIEDRRLVLLPLDLAFTGELRPYQQRAFDAVIRREHGCVCIPTGGGKTVVALAVIAHRQQPTLILVHTKELVYQWRDRIGQFLGVDAGQLGDGKFDLQPITVGVINTARSRLDELHGRFGQVIVDECHRCPSAMFTEVVSSLNAKYLLGLSATPYRRDGLTAVIHWFLGAEVARVHDAELQRLGAILKPEVIRVETAFDTGLDPSRDYQQMISRLTLNEGRNYLIADTVVENANGQGTSLVVSDRLAHCKTLAGLVESVGLTTALLTGRTPRKERQEIVEDVQAGRVQVLVATAQLLGEGFDCSGLSTLFLATPMRFTGRVKQVVGRILRPAEGKRARVFDFVDNRIGMLANQAKYRWRDFV
jgi:superfamily II DNA or RNA helicase